jgi:hypothetical protein
MMLPPSAALGGPREESQESGQSLTLDSPPSTIQLFMSPRINLRGGWSNQFMVQLAISACLSLRLLAHQGVPPLSAQIQAKALSTVQQLVLPPTDVQAELAADGKSTKIAPVRFAVARKLEVTPETNGTWEQLATGKLWRLRIVSAGATDLNLGFTTYWMPEGATLYIISESQGYYQGPYTSEHNAEHGQLWTPVVPGDAVVIEMCVPAGAKEQPALVLGQVSTGYRDMFHLSKDLATPKAESCEIDAVCPQAAAWSNEVRSAACLSLSGTRICSGTLIMDAAGDFRPFLLTANHCEITAQNAATLVAYWNYQSPSCGMHGANGSLTQNTSGSSFRAARADVDFCLVELSTTPAASYAVYYAGWDRSGIPPNGGVAIHHPNVDGTCVSFSSTPLTTTDSCIGTGGVSTHWLVTWGNQGVTEPGSSGSGIWDPASHNVVGTLSGGLSDCAAAPQDLWDCYGKLAVAWDGGNSAAERLRDWLDPGNTGIVQKPGAYPYPRPRLTLVGTALVSEGCQPANGIIDGGETVTVNLTLRNDGTLPTANLVATLLPTSGVASPSAPQSFGILAAGGASVSRSFTFTANAGCGDTINPTFRFQDGSDDLGGANYYAVLGTPIVVFSQKFDNVTAPALPANWTSNPAGVWATTTASADTAPNSVLTSDPAVVTNKYLISPSIAISSTNAQITFRHRYVTEASFDGGVLEISISGGTYNDILAAGGSFITGAYNDTISTSYESPIGGRDAWSGNSSGFITTIIRLPANAAGNNVRFRWRMATDDSNVGGPYAGWYVDTVSVADGYSCCLSAGPPTLSSPGLVGSQFRFSVTGTAGMQYAVEGSTNLINWVRLVTNTSPFTYTQTNPSAFPMRFYRAVHP